jgi:uncharacterized protein (TIGR02145 family)
MRNVFIFLLTLLACSAGVTAQVTIGKATSPHEGAGLDLRSDNKGLLLPRVALTNAKTFQLTGDSRTATGMMVYNTDDDKLDGAGVYVWDGGQWVQISCVPKMPGEIIFSNTTVPENTQFSASVPSVEGATTYVWKIPEEMTIKTNSNSHAITIEVGAQNTYDAGTITVWASNECGDSKTRSSASEITVTDCDATPIPVMPGSITLSNTFGKINTVTDVVQNETLIASATPAEGATAYKWLLPTSVEFIRAISSGNEIEIRCRDLGNYENHLIIVQATNGCKDSEERSFNMENITVIACADALQISNPNDTIITHRGEISTLTDKTLSINVTGNGTPTYQWQNSADAVTWADMTGQLESEITVPLLEGGDNYYRCIVTNSSGGCITISGIFALHVCTNFMADFQNNRYCIGDFGSAGMWMTENLRSTQWPNNTNMTASSDYDYPNKDKTLFGFHPEYGLLYPWATATNKKTSTDNEGNAQNQIRVRGICPDGWHVPSDYEWSELEKEIATNPTTYSSQTQSFTATNTGYNFFETASPLGDNRPYIGTSTVEDSHLNWGRQMKSLIAVHNSAKSPGGTSKSSASNGFDALLVGYINFPSNADQYGESGYFWSSSSYDNTYAYARRLDREHAYTLRSRDYKKVQRLSVRCKQN